MNNINWIEYVKINTDQENIAVIKDKNGINRFFKITIEGFSKSADFIVIFSDITEELKKSKELEKKAYHDTLTKIYSRERFEHFLNQKLNQKREFSLIMFDIDHFKDVNDNYGHDIGDIVLKEITQLVSQHIREEDIFARWGGEEFMIIVNTDVVKAERFANKLRKVIEKNKFTNVNHISCSFGVAGSRQEDKYETILKRVDNMLYSAKNSGRNCVVVIN